MTVMVALLRGINVGGRGKLPMADLRAIVEGLGHTDVRTYIQSGNVVFRTRSRSTASVASALADAIAAGTDVTTTVVLRTADELVVARDADPFVAGGEDPGSVHITFFPGVAPDPGDLSAYAPDTAVPVGGELHLFLPNGLGRSKLAADLDRKLAPGGTTRNWRTVTSLIEMATRDA
jgi:uncharacterized protein (DUF1697 family)